jgi:hypothetical protein
MEVHACNPSTGDGGRKIKVRGWPWEKKHEILPEK